MKFWKLWVSLFEDKEDPAEPHYDPVHLAVVLVATQVAIGALYWLLWTVFVYEGGFTARLRLAHVVALALCSLVIAALYTADRRHSSPPQVKVLLLLGANLGDRAGTLRRAVAAIRKWDGCRVRKVSRIYETAPVGPSEMPYLNQAVALEAERTPMGLLIDAKILEAAAGRKPGVRWGSRPLDVDVVACGKLRVRTPWLAIPHPRVAGRAFALAPLSDVAGSWKPDGRRTTRRLLAALNPGPKTVRLWS